MLGQQMLSEEHFLTQFSQCKLWIMRYQLYSFFFLLTAVEDLEQCFGLKCFSFLQDTGVSVNFVTDN